MNNKPTIKIDFCDFTKTFNKEDNIFINLLRKKYNPIISVNPDFLFYSAYFFGRKHCKYTCTKIFYTGENVRPDFLASDFAFSFDYSNDSRNYRLPLYKLWGNLNDIKKPEKDFEKIFKSKTKFCCFVVSNPNCTERNEFFSLLSKYKQVDSGGRIMNNIGGPAPKKLDFISDYKFVIAFENSSFPGYTTEKIFEGMLVNSIPIYWGNPLIHLEFNDKSFINAHQYGSLQEVVDKIIELDQDDNKYKEYLKQPYFKNNQISATLSDEAILDQLTFIIENEKKKKNIFQKKARHLYCLIKYFNDLAKATIKLKYYKYIKYKNIK